MLGGTSKRVFVLRLFRVLLISLLSVQLCWHNILKFIFYNLYFILFKDLFFLLYNVNKRDICVFLNYKCYRENLESQYLSVITINCSKSVWIYFWSPSLSINSNNYESEKYKKTIKNRKPYLSKYSLKIFYLFVILYIVQRKHLYISTQSIKHNSAMRTVWLF